MGGVMRVMRVRVEVGPDGTDGADGHWDQDDWVNTQLDKKMWHLFGRRARERRQERVEVQDLLQEDPLQVDRMDDIAEVMAPIDDFGIDDDEIERELRELEAEMEQVYVQCAYVYVCVCRRWMCGVWVVDGWWMGGVEWKRCSQRN